GGGLQLISVLPDSEGGAGTNGVLGDEPGSETARHAVSNDGARVFWHGGSGNDLYMRDLVKGETLRLDAAESTCPESKCASGGGRLPLASSEGSRVFCLDSEKLTEDSGATSGEPDLYECEVVEEAGKLKCRLSDLTPLSSG